MMVFNDKRLQVNAGKFNQIRILMKLYPKIRETFLGNTVLVFSLECEGHEAPDTTHR